MNRARFHIAHLMGLVGLAAVAMLAWLEGRHATDAVVRWLVGGRLPRTMMGVACGMALAAVFVALARKGRARWFAVGYAATFILSFYSIDQLPGLKRCLDDPVATRSCDMAASLAGGLMARALARRPADASTKTPLMTAQP